VTHSAYAVDLALFAALGAFIAAGPRWLAGLAVLAQCSDFLVIWVFGSAQDAASHGSGSNPVMLALMAASTLAIMVTLYASQQSGDPVSSVGLGSVKPRVDGIS
jgi:hypothetical protein